LTSHPKSKHTRESIDGLFKNKLKVIQAVRGYRVSEDALFLTWFVRPRPGELILDAGTGCGVIAFGLAVKESSIKVVGLEIQEGLVDRAARGTRLNRLESRVSIVRGDLRLASRYFRHRIFDAVVSNPPYYEPGRGRVNLEHEKALARHQLMMPLVELCRTAGQLLRSEGRLSLIYPADRVDQVDSAFKDAGFKPSRMLWIHPREGAPPSLVCVEAVPSEHDQTLIEARLLIYDGAGARTREAEAILAGEEPARNRIESASDE
jgi:tRNA1Val (adenine37-N6)-methyltransferase